MLSKKTESWPCRCDFFFSFSFCSPTYIFISLLSFLPSFLLRKNYSVWCQLTQAFGRKFFYFTFCQTPYHTFKDKCSLIQHLPFPFPYPSMSFAYWLDSEMAEKHISWIALEGIIWAVLGIVRQEGLEVQQILSRYPWYRGHRLEELRKPRVICFHLCIQRGHFQAGSKLYLPALNSQVGVLVADWRLQTPTWLLLCR